MARIKMNNVSNHKSGSENILTPLANHIQGVKRFNEDDDHRSWRNQKEIT